MRNRRAILAGVAMFLVALLIYLFLVRARQSELGDVRDQVEAAENETQVLEGELQRLQALQENAPRLQADLAEIRELVPENNEVPNFVFLVQQAANASGVGFVTITPELPKPPPEGAAVAEVRITLSANGGYFSMQDFVRRLHNLDRAVRVDNLTMSAVTDTETGTTSIDLEATARIFFELPPNAALGGTSTGAPPGAGTTPAPGGTTPATTATPTATP